MQITYIHHSAFLVETDTCTLLFDDYKGKLPPVREALPFYIFHSHAHGDHYARRTYRHANLSQQTVYLLSDDIPRGDAPVALRDRCHYLHAPDTYEDALISVRTLPSNDQGVAFCVSLSDQGKKRELYFAGDLNAWNWDGDEEDLALCREYEETLRTIRGTRFDVAFIPFDPRLGARIAQGITDFLKAADADVIVPMHFWKKHEVMETAKGLPFYDRFVPLTQEGQVFSV